MGVHATIIRLSPLIHEGEQQYKPCIVGDPRVVTPPLKNPGYAPADAKNERGLEREKTALTQIMRILFSLEIVFTMSLTI